MVKNFFIFFYILTNTTSISSQVIWSSPRPFFEYCSGQCFEIYDTIIGFEIDTSRFSKHLIVFTDSNSSDTIYVPMRNVKFNYCFQNIGNYKMSDLYKGFINGTEICCSGTSDFDFIKIKGCPPVANFYNITDTICKDEYLTINDNTTREPTNWQWQFYGSNTEFYNGKAPPNIRYNETGIYPIQLIASNAYGSDTLVKNITIAKCNDCIYSPNAFSPNNDGINDVFKVYSNCILDEFKIQIYNRWANLVFESNDINYSWNGEYKNTYSAADIYSYLISFKNFKSIKTEYKKGSLMLLK